MSETPETMTASSVPSIKSVCIMPFLPLSMSATLYCRVGHILQTASLQCRRNIVGLLMGVVHFSSCVTPLQRMSAEIDADDWLSLA